MLDARFWDKYFQVYDSLNELIPYRNMVIHIVETLKVEKDERLLDVGCGTGNVAIRVTEKGGEVTGIDISEEGLNRYKQKNPSAITRKMDIAETPWPFEDSSFDKVYSNNTLYTIDPAFRDDVFSEMYRVLKPGGWIVLSNIVEGFSPRKIYFSHIRTSFHEKGMFRTIFDILKLVVPTVKIFYYNHLIKKESSGGSFRLLQKDEQKDRLAKSGFANMSEGVEVYARQAILNMGEKPS